MPAFSYKERFVPFVLDGSKPHTIRARRKNPAKPGDMLYHYFGLRTKWCKKLREDICTDVRTIIISDNNIGILDDRISDQDFELIKQKTFLTQAFFVS